MSSKTLYFLAKILLIEVPQVPTVLPEFDTARGAGQLHPQVCAQLFHGLSLEWNYEQGIFGGETRQAMRVMCIISGMNTATSGKSGFCTADTPCSLNTSAFEAAGVTGSQ